MKNNNNIHLNTSAKYKNNKFQIKYLKYKKYNMVLFATYFTELDVDNIFLHGYQFSIYFDRTLRTLNYVNDMDYIGIDINIRPLMIHFGIDAYKYLTQTQEYRKNNKEE